MLKERSDKTSGVRSLGFSVCTTLPLSLVDSVKGAVRSSTAPSAAVARAGSSGLQSPPR